MLKNIIIINDFAFINGGAAKVAITSACELSRRCYHVIYFAAVGPIANSLISNGVEVHCLNQYDILNNPSRLGAVKQGIWNDKAEEELKELLSNYNHDNTVIHMHGINKALSASVLKVTSSTDFQILWTMHDYFAFCPNGGMFNYKTLKICEKKAMSFNCKICNCDSRSYPQKVWRIWRQLCTDKWLRRNKNISFITISKLNKDIAYPYLKGITKKWYFLQNPISLGDKPQIVNINHNNKYLFIGRLSKEKGLDLFCKAMTDLNLKGLVLGDGYLLEEYKKKYPNVEFAGWVSGKEKDKLIMQGKALLFPSLWYEGAPLTILEMKAYGIPCIVPDKCAAAEEIDNDKTGFIFKTGELKSFEDAILKFESCNLIQMQQNILQNFYSEDYSIGKHVNQLTKIYKDCLSMSVLPTYESQTEKDNLFFSSIYIDDEKSLVAELAKIKSKEKDYLFRGVNSACFKMYSSSQREWMNRSIVKKLTKDDYYRFIINLIHETADRQEVKDYIQKEGVTYNEFFILALMQHFGVPSPMLDFSLSLEKALFFATDGALNGWVDDGTDKLDNYVSLYFLPNKVDWVQATLQSVTQNSAESIDSLLNNTKINDPSLFNRIDTKNVENNIRYALFRQFIPGPQSNISFLPVNGPADGRVKIDIPILNFHCDYYIINDRLLSQEGMFITNFTIDEPLVELMNRVCNNKLFTCINFRKSLVPYIVNNFLTPNQINRNTVYCVGDPIVDGLQKALDNVKKRN